MNSASWNSWWYSAETLSKILNGLAILVIAAAIATLVLKLRSDYLKKQADAPRKLSQEQRTKFIAALANVTKGKISIAHSNPKIETIQFAEEMQSLLKEAGFDLPPTFEYSLAYVVNVPSPWFMGIIVGDGQQPPYTKPLQQAFREIGIDAIGINGHDIAQPGQIKVYIGSK